MYLQFNKSKWENGKIYQTVLLYTSTVKEQTEIINKVEIITYLIEYDETQIVKFYNTHEYD